MNETAEVDYSPLYCAYNGFMLGQFFHQCHLPYTVSEYPRLCRRIGEFLEEVGVEHRLPESHVDFQSYVNTKPLDLWPAKLFAKSVGLGNYFLLGLGSSEYFMMRAMGREPKEEYEKFLLNSEEHGVPLRIIEKLAADLPENPEHADVSVTEFLGVSLKYLARLLDSLMVDEKVVFVVMPFEDRFLDRFTTFYRPAAVRLGYRAIRAWGGLDIEVFSGALVGLIGKCDWVLADVSTLNANVLYEVGLAHGFGKNVMMVSETEEFEIPANLGEYWIRPYFPGEEDWEEEAMGGVGIMITATKLAETMQDKEGFLPDLTGLVTQEASCEDATPRS